MTQSSRTQDSLETISLTIDNQTGRGNLYLYAVGTTDPTNPKNNKYYLKDFDGNLGKCVGTNGAYISYSMLIENAQQVIRMPKLAGFRFYFSFDAKLYVTVPNDGGNAGIPNEPAGWVASDKNFHTLFDYVELTWVSNANDATIGANLTQLDAFALPIQLDLTGYDSNGKAITLTSGFRTPGVRNKIMQELLAAGDPWKNLVIQSNSENLRAISPYHGMPEEGNNLFPNTQLDAYISAVWQKYETDTLQTSAEGVAFSGKVSNNVLTFTASGQDPIHFPKPTTREVYLQGPVPEPASPKAGVIQAALQAGFMRSTLLQSTQLPECNADLFYKQEPINEYAGIIHQNSINGGAYAFGFDDVCNTYSSVIIVHNPVSAKITLNAL